MTFRSPLANVTVDAATIFLLKDNPRAPVVDASFSAKTAELDISGYSSAR